VKTISSEDWGAYIPQDRRRALAEGRELALVTSGTALLADISGFTRLSEQYSLEFGSLRGAEEVTLRLNGFFDRIIQTLNAYQGSVISFSGDAVTCWFDGDDGSLALACALEVQKLKNGEELSLEVKIALAAGPARRFLVGDPKIQSLDVMAGEVFQRMARIEKVLQKGEIGLDQRVAALLSAVDPAHQVRRTSEGEPLIVVPQGVGLSEPLIPAPVPKPLPEVSQEVARSWLPDAVFQRIRLTQPAFVADLRLAVVFFIRFETRNFDTDDRAPEELIGAIRFVQATVDRYEGTLLQVVVGDKGTYLYGAFGAPLAHENEAHGALSALLELRDKGPQVGLKRLQVGVSQGLIYAGAYGGTNRKTYGVVGSEVNLAARIMELAPADTVLVSAAVFRTTGAHFQFAPAGTPVLKGIAVPIPLYTLLVARPRHEVVNLKSQVGTPLSGREHDFSFFLDRLDLLAAGHGGAAVIVGEPGIGKSRFVDELEFQARQSGILVFKAGADAIESQSPYYTWRPVFHEVFGIDPYDSTTADGETLALRFEGDPERTKLLPLLGPVMALPLADNEFTAALSAETRVTLTHELMVDQLRRVVELRGEPLCLILEDVHWMDASSWALLQEVLKNLPQALVLVTSRPLTRGLCAPLDALMTRPELMHVRLEALPHKALAEVVRNRLGVKALAPEIELFLARRAEGNPFFGLELIFAMRDTKILSLEDGRAVLSSKFTGWDNLPFPDTLSGVVASRIDRLPAAAQGVLKVASVIGRQFPLSTLEGLHTGQLTGTADLAGPLRVLEEAELVAQDRNAAVTAYSFRHVVIQQITYGLLLFQQRQDLHRRVAEWYEVQYAGNLVRYAPVLAYHWREAGEPERSVGYFVAAGHEALRHYNNQGALAHFVEGLRLDGLLEPSSLSARARGEVELAMGEAYVLVSQLEAAIVHLENGLELLGQGVPKNPAVFVGRILKALWSQSRTRRGFSRSHHLVDQNRSELESACRALITLADQYGTTNRLAKTLYATVVGMDLVERLGLAAMKARSYSYWAVTLDFLGMKKTATVYMNLAEVNLPGHQGSVDGIATLLGAGFFYSGRGDFRSAATAFADLGEAALATGNHRRTRDSYQFQIYLLVFQGYFAEALEQAKLLTGLSEDFGDPDMAAIALSWQVLVSLDSSDPRAPEYHAALEEALSRSRNELYRMICLAIQSLYCLRRDDPESARKLALTAADYFRSKKTVLFSEYFLAVLTTETLFELGDAFFGSALDSLRRYARSYPIGRPSYCRLRGAALSAHGRHRQALRWWAQGIEVAHEFGMHLERGRLALDMGSSPLLGAAEKQAKAEEALEIFRTLGLKVYTEQAERLLVGRNTP